MQETENLKGQLFPQICKGNGYRAPGRQPNLMHHWKAVSVMWLMLCFPVLMVGCLMVKMHLGQVKTMSLDNQRNLKLAISKDPVFLKVAEAGGQQK